MFLFLSRFFNRLDVLTRRPQPKDSSGWPVYTVSANIVVRSKEPPQDAFEQLYGAGLRQVINSTDDMECIDIDVHTEVLEK